MQPYLYDSYKPIKCRVQLTRFINSKIKDYENTFETLEQLGMVSSPIACYYRFGNWIE